jgi:hypothetical protein
MRGGYETCSRSASFLAGSVIDVEKGHTDSIINYELRITKRIVLEYQHRVAKTIKSKLLRYRYLI